MEGKQQVIVDVGSNITNLVQKLATQIGITADKIFPWYIHQAMMVGTIKLTAGLLLTTAFLGTMVWGIRSVNKLPRKWDTDFTPWYPIVIISGICGTIALVVTCICLPDCVSQIFNPQYWAVHAIMRDVAHLH